MPYASAMLTIDDTLAFIEAAHAGQTDKGGFPYTDHLKRVWQDVRARLTTLDLDSDEKLAIEHAALLRDVLEDTATTAQDLLDRGYPARTVALVRALSRPEGEGRPSYQDWIKGIAASGDRGLILIKLADNRDNADPKRIAQLPEAQRGIARRYARAYQVLVEGLERLGA